MSGLFEMGVLLLSSPPAIPYKELRDVHRPPGPRDPGVITPRPIVTREVTMNCSRCQQPVHTVQHRAAQARKAYAATTTKAGMRTVM